MTRFHGPSQVVPLSPLDAVRRDCDMALALMVMPFLLPLSWWLLARRYRAPVPADRGERRHYLSWRRRLTGLIALDTLLVAGLALINALGLPIAGQPTPPRIGVLLDPVANVAKVDRVMDGSPAAAADLHPGDIITAVDGEPVSSAASLSKAISSGTPDSSRSLSVSRGEETLTIAVTPTVAPLRVTPAKGFFEPDPHGGSCADALTAASSAPITPLAIGIGLVLLLWLVAVIRGGGLAGAGWGSVVLALLAAPVAAAGASYQACQQLGGMSLGVSLIGLIAQGFALLLVGGAVWWWLRPQLRMVLGPQLSLANTVARGGLFMIAAVVRVGLAATVLMTLFPGAGGQADSALADLFSGGGNLLGRAMVLLAAVILAPLAEETIFRGVILPGLARRMRPATALWLTAIVFGVFHIPSHGGGAIVPGLLGLIFGWARLRSGNLKAPIILHAANNLFVTLLAWFASG